MEHLFFLLIHFIAWLDRRSLKPLNKVVPNLDELYERPAEVLSRGDIVIGPQRRWASAVGLGLFIGVVLTFIGLALLLMFTRGRNRLPRQTVLGIAGVGLVVLPTVSVIVMLRLLRGGRMTLRAEGVELADRDQRVLCPWALFNVEGVPFQPGGNAILLPVDPLATPLVELYRDDRLAATGTRVQTRPLSFKSANVVVLNGVYQVEVPELGGMLLQLGRVLGTARPRPPGASGLPNEEAMQETPRLVRRRDGWIRASLVHLAFPPYCCGCGAQTADRKEFHGYSMSVTVGKVTLMEVGDEAKLEVPVCPECQREHDRLVQRTVLSGLIGGVLVAAGVVTWLCLKAGKPDLGLLFVPLGVLGLVIGGMIGNRIGRVLASPVRLREYSSSEGALSLWFRDPAYGDALVELHDGVEEPATEEEEVAS